MILIRIFDRWYVHPDERSGEQPNDLGRWVLRFDGAPDGARACINGKLQPLVDGTVEITARAARLSMDLWLPSGAREEVECLVFNGDRLLPGTVKADAFMLWLACRLQDLEQRVGDDERDIQGIRDKKQGAYFLGGAKQ